MKSICSLSNNKVNIGHVIIIGSDHYNTYGIVRSLGEEGIHSDVIILGCKKKDSFVLISRYVDNGFGCSNHEDAIGILKSYQGRDNVLICCSDEAEEMILKHYDELTPCLILPVCEDPTETSRLMDKSYNGALAERFDIAVPKSWVVKNRRLPENVPFPCITKPLTSQSGHKADIVVCRNLEELNSVITAENHCADYVVQQYIEYEKEVSILGAVLADGSVVLSGCIDKLRTCMIGTTSFGMMVDNCLLGNIIPKLEAMMKSTGYRGLFSAEFLLKDGVFYFLEVNFRNDGNTYVATASGQNLPFLYVKSIMEDIQESEEKQSYPCYFMLEIEDFLALRRNRVPLRQWKNDYKKAKACLVYNKQDINPFKKKLKTTIMSMAKRAWHKLVLRKNNA